MPLLKEFETDTRVTMYYGWIIASCGFLISFVGFGIRYSYGVFLSSLEAEFEMTRTAASVIFSANMVLCAFIAFFSGWLLDRYGPRPLGIFFGVFTTMSLISTSMVSASWQLFVTYSLLLALGTGAIYSVVNATVSRWFITRRGLAVGFASSGGGTGIFAFSPLASYLILSYEWRSAFYVIGVFSGAAMIILALFLRKDPSDLELQPDGAESGVVELAIRPSPAYPMSQFFKAKQLWQLSLLWLSVSISVHLVIVHVVSYAISKGISNLEAAFIMSLLGLMSIFGRLLAGMLSDQFGRKFIGIFSSLILCCVLLFLIIAHTLWMFYVFAILFGLMWGGVGTVITALVGDIFGLSRIGTIMGITSSMWAFGAAIGPVIGGIVYDMSGYYSAAFVVGASSLLISIVLLAQLKPLQLPDN